MWRVCKRPYHDFAAELPVEKGVDGGLKEARRRGRLRHVLQHQGRCELVGPARHRQQQAHVQQRGRQAHALRMRVCCC